MKLNLSERILLTKIFGMLSPVGVDEARQMASGFCALKNSLTPEQREAKFDMFNAPTGDEIDLNLFGPLVVVCIVKCLEGAALPGWQAAIAVEILNKFGPVENS